MASQSPGRDLPAHHGRQGYHRAHSRVVDGTLHAIGADYEQYRAKRRFGQAYIILALSDEGDYVGFIESELRRDHVEGAPTRPVWYVEGIYVAPTARKKGVGRFLISVLESHARAEGHAVIASDCEFDDTDSESFHKAVGFTEVLRDIHLVKTLDGPPKSIPEALYGSSRPQSGGLEGEIDVRRSGEQDRDWLLRLFETHWSDATVACRGRVIVIINADSGGSDITDLPQDIVGTNHYWLSGELPSTGISFFLFELDRRIPIIREAIPSLPDGHTPLRLLSHAGWAISVPCPHHAYDHRARSPVYRGSVS